MFLLPGIAVTWVLHDDPRPVSSGLGSATLGGSLKLAAGSSVLLTIYGVQPLSSAIIFLGQFFLQIHSYTSDLFSSVGRLMSLFMLP